MKIDAVELRRLALPLVAPFRTSWGTEDHRDVLLVTVLGPDSVGWGECVAMNAPLYSSEYTDAAHALMRTHLVPLVLGVDDVRAEQVGDVLGPVVGHPMAKAAVEMAVLDAELRAEGRSFASFLGGVRATVPAGVAVGIHDSVQELVEVVERYVDAGYRRVKLKIERGWDVEPVRAVRERCGDELLLQVDANAAYTTADVGHLSQLDAFDLACLEQPLPADDLLGHVELAKGLRTPVCLDETITSARVARAAVAMGACSVVNVKAGRVGGYLEARRVHDVCSDAGVPVWCGGMLETGLGRAGNVALASLPGFTLPGDLSASDRYFERDVTPPFVLEEGGLRVPTGPGLGVEVSEDVVAACTTSVETIRRT